MTLLTARSAALWMAGMGVISGVLSDLSLSLSVPHPLGLLDAPIYPGLIFGLAIALGLYLLGKAGLPGALLALLITVIAWVAAFHGCILIYDALAIDPTAGYQPRPLDESGSIDREAALRLRDAVGSNLFALTASLIAGGAIGAGGTALGAAIVAPAGRSYAWLLTTFVGAVCAVALFAIDTLIGAPPGYEFLALFVVWQAAVAASVGYGIAGSGNT